MVCSHMVPTLPLSQVPFSRTLPSLGFFLLWTLGLWLGAPLLQHDLILTLVTSATALPPGKVALCGLEHPHTLFIAGGGDQFSL